MVIMALRHTKSKEKEKVLRKAFSLFWGVDANDWDGMAEDLKMDLRKKHISNGLCTAGGGEQVITTADRGFGNDSLR